MATESASSPVSPSSSWSDARPPVGAIRLWFGVLAVPFAWSGHVLVLYGFSTFMCSLDAEPDWTPQVHALSWPFVLVTLVSYAVAITGLWIAVRNFRRTRVPKESKMQPTEIVAERAHFLARCGMINSVVFMAAFLFTTADMVVAPLCGK